MSKIEAAVYRLQQAVNKLNGAVKQTKSRLKAGPAAAHGDLARDNQRLQALVSEVSQRLDDNIKRVQGVLEV